METSDKSIGQPSQDLTLFAVDTPANHSATPENEREQQTPDIYGQQCLTPFAIYDPAMHCWKTSEDICLWGSEKYCQTLPASGLMQSGRLFPQPRLVRHTKETGYLLWPTPTAVSRPNEGNMRLMRAKVLEGEIALGEANAIVGKNVFLAHGKLPALWPTPTTQEVEHPQAVWNENNRRVARNGSTHSMGLADAVQMWPTPTADDASNVNPKPNRFRGLVAAVNETVTPNNGKLNPAWVEWLMGFPLGWTDLED